MGPKNSTIENKDQNTIKINHQIFALSKLIKGKQDEDLIQTQVRLANKNQFKAWAKRADELQANDSLMIPFAKQYQEEGMCGSSGMALITYENFPYLLSDQITNRQSLQKKLFQENQLWYLVYTLLSAANTYHEHGVKVGDIRPDNIFINEDGQVKVASVDSWPGQQTNYAKSFYEKEITYLSPEQIKDYQFGKMQQSGDKVLAQTFSIGLTCLDAATLSESKSLYSKNFKFSYEKLQNRINEFRKIGYSELLTLTIQNMCQVDTEFRSSSRQILKWLLPHEDAIVNLEDFQVNGLPQKMQLARERNLNASSHLSTTVNYQSSTYQAPSSVPFHTTFPVLQPIQQIQPSQPVQTVQQSQPGQPINFNIPSYVLPSTQYQNVSFQPSQYVAPTNFQYISQPISSTFQPTNPLSVMTQKNTTTTTTTSYNYQPTNVNFNVDESHKSMLQKIDQQLQQSRKMFPTQ